MRLWWGRQQQLQQQHSSGIDAPGGRAWSVGNPPNCAGATAATAAAQQHTTAGSWMFTISESITAIALRQLSTQASSTSTLSKCSGCVRLSHPSWPGVATQAPASGPQLLCCVCIAEQLHLQSGVLQLTGVQKLSVQQQQRDHHHHHHQQQSQF